MKSKKAWERIKDNRMRWHGDIDYEKKIIRVNKAKKKNPKKGEIINTIVHEETHRLHPKMWEKTVDKETAEKLKALSQVQKNKLYSRYQ